MTLSETPPRPRYCLCPRQGVLGLGFLLLPLQGVAVARWDDPPAGAEEKPARGAGGGAWLRERDLSLLGLTRRL